MTVRAGAQDKKMALSHIHLIFIDDEHNTDDCGK